MSILNLKEFSGGAGLFNTWEYHVNTLNPRMVKSRYTCMPTSLFHSNIWTRLFYQMVVRSKRNSGSGILNSRIHINPFPSNKILKKQKFYQNTNNPRGSEKCLACAIGGTATLLLQMKVSV